MLAIILPSPDYSLREGIVWTGIYSGLIHPILETWAH